MHVLVECMDMADGTVGLRQRRFGLWAFVTLWSVAREALAAMCEDLTCYAVRATEDTLCTVKVEPFDRAAADFGGLGRQVWPDAYKPAARPKRECPDGRDGPARRARRPGAKGGIAAVAPTQTTLLPHPVAAAVPPPRARRRLEVPNETNRFGLHVRPSKKTVLPVFRKRRIVVVSNSLKILFSRPLFCLRCPGQISGRQNTISYRWEAETMRRV